MDFKDLTGQKVIVVSQGKIRRLTGLVDKVYDDFIRLIPFDPESVDLSSKFGEEESMMTLNVIPYPVRRRKKAIIDIMELSKPNKSDEDKDK